jgi:hypothetical protein
MAFPLAPIRCEIDGESFSAQPASDEFRQFPIVFDYEYSHDVYPTPAFQSARIKLPLDFH